VDRKVIEGDSMDNGTLTNQKELNFGSDGRGGTEAIECEACNCTTAKLDDLHLRSHFVKRWRSLLSNP